MNDHQHLRERVDERVSKRGASACAPACAYVYMRVPIRPYATDATRRLHPPRPIPSMCIHAPIRLSSASMQLRFDDCITKTVRERALEKKKKLQLIFSSIYREKHKMRVERVKFRN